MALTENAILAQLWQKTIKELKLTKALPSLIRRVVSGTKSARYRDIGAYNRNISSEEMSFKTFVSLLHDLLNVKKIRFKIELLHHNGTITEHDISIIRDNVGEDTVDINKKKSKKEAET